MTVFSEQLHRCMAEKGLSGYRVAIESGLQQQSLSAILKGKRQATEHVIQGLAKCESLGLTYEQMKAWMLLDQMGEDGLAALRQYAPNVMAGLRVPTPPSPDELFDEHTFADAPFPPTAEERAIINRGLQLDVKYGPAYTAAFWSMPAEERREHIFFLEGLVRRAEGTEQLKSQPARRTRHRQAV